MRVLTAKFCGLAPLTVLQEILSVLTSRGWLLNHLVDCSIGASKDLLLRYFVETGFFDFLTYYDVSRGYAQAIKENTGKTRFEFNGNISSSRTSCCQRS